MGDDVTEVYTDGACSGNPGPGGWAWAIPDGRWASGAAARTTNQRMELTAVLEAVKTLDEPVEIVSDSTYVVNCFRDGWWKGWLQRGWVNSKKQPVANRDLWEPLVEIYRARDDIRFRWVKGHSGDEHNDLVDRLAVAAMTAQRGGHGDRPPADLGPADRPRGRTGPTTQGHRVVITGHRPTELGGYDDNPTARRVRDTIEKYLLGLKWEHDDLVVVTGLRLGAEMLAAEAAGNTDVPYRVVLPFPEPHSVWPPESQERFRRLVDGAESVTILQSDTPTSKQAAGLALGKLDKHLEAVADAAIVVWDRQDGNLGRMVNGLNSKLDHEVIVIEP